MGFSTSAIGHKMTYTLPAVVGLEPMPTYSYRCEKCGKKFERTETISEHETAKSKCPKCGSKKVSVVPSRVYVVTSKKS
jgi:putative FmdB family regulatory protein